MSEQTHPGPAGLVAARAQLHERELKFRAAKAGFRYEYDGAAMPHVLWTKDGRYITRYYDPLQCLAYLQGRLDEQAERRERAEDGDPCAT